MAVKNQITEEVKPAPKVLTPEEKAAEMLCRTRGFGLLAASAVVRGLTKKEVELLANLTGEELGAGVNAVLNSAADRQEGEALKAKAEKDAADKARVSQEKGGGPGITPK